MSMKTFTVGYHGRMLVNQFIILKNSIKIKGSSIYKAKLTCFLLIIVLKLKSEKRRTIFLFLKF